ncbi:type VI secretion system-associated FHA domain protein TagH [Vibrio sinensis]|uniref:Type VI secretion system-associated FHA domain protein TagH n=1 Tax=Vibrio sinensis TaxID=2302434 RepID=A0A3A6R2T5_9VIBR|nr:type VI secretion system-associated FHA domain protein TagH [Vibrio sinensis]RJX75654.1 type VI secretion system-associated FHA domain protein TagH [Vibrio sinensis]
MQKNQVLSMVVSNAQRLRSGLSAQHVFTQDGGVIGAADGVAWQLSDAQGSIQHRHCEVAIIDGEFCVKDLCGATYVNGSHMPLGKGLSARLEHNNEVGIGPYRIRVTFSQVGDESSQVSASINTLFDGDRFDLLKDGDVELLDTGERIATQTIDPLTALNDLFTKTSKQDRPQSTHQDSLLEEIKSASFEQEGIVPGSNVVLESNIGLAQPQFTQQADSEYEMTSSIRLKKILGFHRNKTDSESVVTKQYETKVMPTDSKKNHDTLHAPEGLGMNDKVLDLLEEEMARSYQPTSDTQNASSMNANHLLTGPMLSGLGVDVGDTHDMDKMHMLSEELGESLKACVQGLLELNQQVCEGRFGVMNRNLQPIEDNPLRLGLSYPETIRTLYDADKSLVHLSAPAAISESLKNVRDHNEAMQHATGEALSQILNAFSPQVLLRRFQHYKRNGDLQNQTPESWAWEMYCHYYKELTSDRQKGFEKLFWEIFEQSYDKKIREKQLEL